MRSPLVAALALCVVVAAAPAHAQSNPMRPGRWQTTMQMQMPNMPQMPPMTMNSTQCITAQQLEKDPASGVPRGTQNPNQGMCKVSDFKISGNSVAWKMTCSGEQAMTGEGEMTFVQDSYTGTMKMAMPQGAMTMKMTGKRLGDCTE
jgi:hypothetical protein